MAKPGGTEAHRERILEAALDLLLSRGRDAVTTRSVADAAAVQPTVLYRLFGDKAGLLEAVAGFGFTAYLAKKRLPAASADPVEVLRAGWDLHVAFGLESPELYLLMYASPRPGPRSQAAQRAYDMLHEHMQHVALAGRLRVGVETACVLYHSAAVGIMLSLLGCAPEQRDLSLSATVRDDALNRITFTPRRKARPTLTTSATALHTLLTRAGGTMGGLTVAEQQLFLEWLQRLARQEAEDGRRTTL